MPPSWPPLMAPSHGPLTAPSRPPLMAPSWPPLMAPSHGPLTESPHVFDIIAKKLAFRSSISSISKSLILFLRISTSSGLTDMDRSSALVGLMDVSLNIFAPLGSFQSSTI